MHKTCFVCGKSNCSGLGIEYSMDEHGEVKGSFFISKNYQDGAGVCHRSIILTLLDSAMVHTLLQRNISGLTVRLDALFVQNIPQGTQVEIRAKIVDQQRELFYMTGTVFSGKTVYATGKATFFARRQIASPVVHS